MSKLLKSLCEIHSPSGEEIAMTKFILKYVSENSASWKVQPKIYCGDGFQDCIVLVFGIPKTAVFAHMDTTGFTVRYQDQLIPTGGPEVSGNEILTGNDSLGEIECTLDIRGEYDLHYQFGRPIESGTGLVYKSNFREDGSFITSPYLDNRAGLYNLLRLAESLENGALVFSCWEEHGGGSVSYLVKFLWEQYQISKMLISDITWISDGIDFERGVVISLRDKNIPRKTFTDQIVRLASENRIPFQREIETFGSSDGREIQISPYPIDWCFVGPPVSDAHTDHERISKRDLEATLAFYKVLTGHL
jgi:putative aminopeptidase FrvX